MFIRASIQVKRATRDKLVMAGLLLGYLLSGCGTPVTGRKLTSVGAARLPGLVWNGSHFGILYLRVHESQAYAEIHALKVDGNGNVVASTTHPLANVPALPAAGSPPFAISDLVWNPDDGQFAFAFSHGKDIYFSRLDEDLRLIFPYFVRIYFPSSPPGEEPADLIDLSLVWNGVRGEYGLTFVTREDPYLEYRHDDIYLSRIAPDGSFVGPYGRAWHFVDCPHDCSRTSLTFNEHGRYRVAYFKDDGETGHVMIGLADNEQQITEHEIMPDWRPRLGWGIRVLYDEPTQDYFVVAVGGPSNDLYSQVVRPDGSGLATVSKTPAGSYQRLFSTANYLAAGHSYMICATRSNQLHCWLATDSWQDDEDYWSFPDDGVVRVDPSLAAVGDVNYLAWSEGGDIYIGPASVLGP